MRKLHLVVGAAALTLACGLVDTQQVNRGGTGVGGSAGSADGGSGESGERASSGASSITGPICPNEEPEAGSNCDSSAVNCGYDVCGDDTSKVFSCLAGKWRVARSCGPLECPPERPRFLSDCAPLEGIQCSYVQDCCGTEPATQTVVARCEFSQWTFLGQPDEACSFCEVHHEDGAACDLPPACKAACYRTSCYGQPLVEECVEGVWLSQTLCSK